MVAALVSRMGPPIRTLLNLLPLYFLLLLFTISPSVDGMHKKYAMDDIAEMAPIHVRDFEHATGIQKRSDASPTDYLAPSSEAHLTYGRPGTADSFLTGNMTLYAPNGLPLVMMERFEELTSAVDCQGHDGELSIIWKSREAFDHALATWKYINDDEKANFLLITNHDGCGDDHQRQTYLISKVDSQEDTLRTVMASKPLEWVQIAGDFDLDFGAVDLTPEGVHQLHRRGPSWDKTANWSMGTKNKRFLVYKDPTWFPPRVTLSCESCYTKGSFRSRGELRTRGWKPTGFTIELNIKQFELEYDFLTEIVFETDCFDNMTAKKNTPVKKLCPKLAQLDKMEFEEPMFSAPVPYLGFKFLKFIEAGVIIHGIIHKELQMFGRFSFNTGIRWKMPPNSRFFLDLNARSASKMEMKGLTKPDFFLEPKEGNMEAQILFFAGPRFDIGLSLFDKLELELQTQFRTPAATLNFSAGYRQEGYCTGNKKDKTGIKVVLQSNIQVWAKIPNPDWGALWTAASTFIGGLNLPSIIPDWNDLSDGLRGAADTVGGVVGDALDAIFKRDADPDDHSGYFRIDDGSHSPEPDSHITNAGLGIGDDADPELDGSGSQPSQGLEIRKLDPRAKKPKYEGKHRKDPTFVAKWWQDRLFMSPSFGSKEWCWPRKMQGLIDFFEKDDKEKAKSKTKKPPKTKKPKPPPKTKVPPKTTKPPTKPPKETPNPPKPTKKPTSPSSEYKSPGCKVMVDGLRHRPCTKSNNKDCPAFGMYFKGKQVVFNCKVKGELVKTNAKDKGSTDWGKASDGHYMSLAYIDQGCAKHIPACKK